MYVFFFFSSRRRHTRYWRDWSSDVCSSDLRGGVEHAWLPFFPWLTLAAVAPERQAGPPVPAPLLLAGLGAGVAIVVEAGLGPPLGLGPVDPPRQNLAPRVPHARREQGRAGPL